MKKYALCTILLSTLVAVFGIFTLSDASNGNAAAMPQGPGGPYPRTETIAYGTVAMPTAMIGTGGCTAVVTVPAPGVINTDVIIWSYGSAQGATIGSLTVNTFPTPNAVNIQHCNTSPNPISPRNVTMNWRVVR